MATRPPLFHYVFPPDLGIDSTPSWPHEPSVGTNSRVCPVFEHADAADRGVVESVCLLNVLKRTPSLAVKQGDVALDRRPIAAESRS